MQGRYLFLVLLLSFISMILARDFYKILGVNRSASKQEIKKTYRELSKTHHPDKTDDPEKHKKYIEYSEVYEVLADDEKRRIYDKYGEEGLKQGGGDQGGFDPFDLFFGGFGGFGRGGRQREKKGPSVELQLEVTLEELFSGVDLNYEVNRQIICSSCRGSGAKDPNDVQTCPSCQGNGIRIIKQMLGPGMYQTMQTTCDACAGIGKISRSKCDHCRGSKVSRGSQEVIVSVEAGMADGTSIVIERAADQAPNTSPGDLIFILKTVPHSIFTRKGDHLYARMTLSLNEALLGFSKTITKLDGSELKVTRNGVTQPGFVGVMKGQGMPKRGGYKEHGNLFIEYQVVFPDSFTDSNKKELKRLLA